MRVSGVLTLRGERFDVDCVHARDRSWSQVRVETPSLQTPPTAWTPMCFDENLAFNQISFEPAATNPEWLGIYDIPDDRPTHRMSWLYANGALREVVRVRRRVLERHPELYAATRQIIEAEDSLGQVHQFHGTAIAMAKMPAWPNATLHDSVFRWETDSGRVCHGTCQELWFDEYHRAMKRRHRSLATTRV
jgi:hypothetical protein